MGFSFCSLLMAILFAYSASVQLNDHDWYFWFPLYACACLVNLKIFGFIKIPTIRSDAKVTLWVGMFLFVKVVIEDYVDAIVGFWSLDLSERVVREKIGSGLVVISMILHLEELSNSKDFGRRKKNGSSFFVKYGMPMLVGVSYGLPFVFFVVQKGEMKF